MEIMKHGHLWEIRVAVSSQVVENYDKILKEQTEQRCKLIAEGEKGECVT